MAYSGSIGRAVAAGMLAGALVLAGCTKEEDRVLFDGNYYPTEARADRSDRQSFTVSVQRVGQGLDGARAAGAHRGKRYCLGNYGTSEISWTVGPAAPASTLGAGSGRLSMRGQCRPW